MTRYYMAVGDALGSVYVQSIESDDGGWVLYRDVESELTRLRTSLAAVEKERDKNARLTTLLAARLVTLERHRAIGDADDDGDYHKAYVEMVAADKALVNALVAGGMTLEQVARAALAGPAATREWE